MLFCDVQLASKSFQKQKWDNHSNIFKTTLVCLRRYQPRKRAWYHLLETRSTAKTIIQRLKDQNPASNIITVQSKVISRKKLELTARLDASSVFWLHSVLLPVKACSKHHSLQLCILYAHLLILNDKIAVRLMID